MNVNEFPENFEHFATIAKIFGLFPCVYDGDKFHTSLWWSNFHPFILSVGFCVYTYFHTTLIENLNEINRVELVVKFIQTHIIFIFLLYTEILSTIFKKHSFAKYLNLLKEYDEKLRKLKYEKSENLHVPWKILSVVTIMVVLYTFVIEYNPTGYDLSEVFLDVILLFLHAYCVFMHFTLLYLLLQRIEFLNAVVIPKSSMVQSRQHITSLEDTRNLYVILRNAVDTLNTIYGALYCFWFYINLTYLLVHVNNIINNYDEFGTLYDVASLIFILLEEILTCTICHVTIKKANNVGMVLVRSNWSHNNITEKLDVIEMGIYLFHDKVSFTGLKMIRVDITLLKTLLATVATYAVTLVQT